MPSFAFANLLFTLSPKMRTGVERGLLMADASSSEGGWKAGCGESICRSFGFFMSLVLLGGEVQSLNFPVILWQ